MPAPADAAGGVTARVGPIEVLEDGRRTVRGGRPEGASIHVAWGPPARLPDVDDREALATFERATFPTAPRQTIVERAPEGWMRELAAADLPIRWNRRTVEYLRYFRDDPRGQTMIKAWMRRAGRYEGRMRAILRRVGVPEDLVMVALAESGFDPRARSPVGAAGLWQFMEQTGSVYGLRSDYWVDERHDIEKATYAAALYLKDLHVRFGSWELALAAYNAGYGLVLTTIERHNTNNYWALCEIESGLPYATTNYVPKIMAAALVSRNRAVFGVDPGRLSPDPPADWIEVRVPQSTSLELVAKAIEVEAALLQEWNAHLVRGRTPPRHGTYGIRIPKDKRRAFERAARELRKAWSAETTHEVRHGETLSAIADTYGMHELALRRMNGILDSAEVPGGVVLVVPRGRAPAVGSPPAPRPLAAVPAVVPGSDQRLVFFVTTRATRPHDLERAFGVRWADIVAWNDLDPHARLQTGQVLQLVVPQDFDPEAAKVVAFERHEVEYAQRGSAAHLEGALARRGMTRRAYRARRGDTLEKIGKRFDLTVGSLARINGFGRDHAPQPGELVIVYVAPQHARRTTRAPAPRGFDDRLATRTPSTADAARVPGGRAPEPRGAGLESVGHARSTDGRAPSTADTARVPRTRRLPPPP